MKIYALSGPPGAGKTHYKKQRFPDHPFFDVADVYADHYGIESQDAFAELLNRITEFTAKQNIPRDIVVEAMLSEGSTQRKWLEYIAEANGYELEYVKFDVPLEICLQRVEQDWNKANQNDLATRSYFNARIKILKELIRAKTDPRG